MTATISNSTCVFCKIGSGAIPSHRVHETDDILAFLDIGPIRPGHVQIIPRTHYDYFEELPPELAARILRLGQRIASAQKRLYGVPRVGFMFTGSDVAHVHAHVVPLVSGSDITSRRYIVEEKVTFRSMDRVPDHELNQIARRIRNELGE